MDKIKNTEAVLTLKTAAANKKSLNLQLNFMTTFSETFKAKWHQYSQQYSNIRRYFNMIIIFTIKTWKILIN